MQSYPGIRRRTITPTSFIRVHSHRPNMTVARVYILLLLACISLHACYAATIPRNFDPRLTEEVLMVPKKRPFCNAFTGCGRKRSQAPPGMPLQEMVHQKQLTDDDSINSLFDTETAIDDISRQILSEAKLWEALQEASAEISRRRQKDINNGFQ